MKKLLSLACILALTSFSLAQSPTVEKVVTVPVSQLKPEVAAQYKDALPEKPQINKYQEYIQLGSAFGDALKGSLSAVTEETNKFADTKVGTFAMFIIAYKVFGADAIQFVKDIMGFVVGAILLAIGFPFWVFFYYRNCLSRQRVTSIKGEGKDKTVTYSLINDGQTVNSRDALTCSRWLHTLALGALVGISLLVMFC